MAFVAFGAGVVIGWACYKLYYYLFPRNPPIQDIVVSEQAASTTNIVDSEENNVQDSGPTSFVMWAGRKVLNKVADSIVVRLVKEYGKEVFEVLQQVWSCKKTNGLVSASVAFVGCIVKKVTSFVSEFRSRVFEILCSAWSFMKQYICELLIGGGLFCDEIAFAFGAGVLIGLTIDKLYNYLKRSGLGNRICNFFARIFEALRSACCKIKYYFSSPFGNNGTNCSETENGRPVRIAEGDVTGSSYSAASGRNRNRMEEYVRPIRATGDDVTSSSDDDVTNSSDDEDDDVPASSGKSAVSGNFSTASNAIIRLRIIS